MKIKIPSFPTFAEIPKESREMWKNFGLLVEAVRTAFANGLTLDDNLSHASFTVQMKHGVQTRFTHSLNRGVKAVVVVGGRAEFLQVVASDVSTVTVKAKLLSTTASASGSQQAYTQQVETDDAAFFVEGDAVLVAGVQNTITRVAGRVLGLSRPVVASNAISVSLSSDTISILVL